MHRIFPNGKVTKAELLARLDRVERLLQAHRESGRPLRLRTANHLADALGCLTKCLVEPSDRALDRAEQAMADPAPEPEKRTVTFTLQELDQIMRDQRVSLPLDEGHPMLGWPLPDRRRPAGS